MPSTYSLKIKAGQDRKSLNAYVEPRTLHAFFKFLISILWAKSYTELFKDGMLYYYSVTGANKKCHKLGCSWSHEKYCNCVEFY